MIENVSKFGIGLSFHHSMHAGDTDVAMILRCYPSVGHIDCPVEIDSRNIDTQNISVFMSEF
jgi:citrate lyase alpha subunit